MPGGDFVDFVLAVAVEGCPLDAGAGVLGPVEDDVGAVVADGEAAAC